MALRYRAWSAWWSFNRGVAQAWWRLFGERCRSCGKEWQRKGLTGICARTADNIFSEVLDEMWEKRSGAAGQNDIFWRTDGKP